mmetsp:Transcript_1041/g.2236  ORF Transcript_1041/g.2236 Transcript_1041/m.2236 type:complete len:608 (+) Transcript_1041:118-1941(+)
MSNTESPAISRRQRAEDIKASISSAYLLPALNSPIYEEKSLKRIEPPLYVKSGCPSLSRSKAASSGGLGWIASSQLQSLRSRFPILKKAKELALRVPPKVRFVFIFFWVAWKVLLLFALLSIMGKRNNDTSFLSSSGILRILNVTGHILIDNNIHITTDATRVLYIITSSVEYNDKSQASVNGQDRFRDQLVPVMIDSVESMTGNSFNVDIDVFLVCAYPLRPEREEIIRNQLPQGVGFQFWDNAAPFAYEGTGISGSISEYKRALARQHRFVVRDKFDYYDVFLAFEDDMLVRGQHVHHYLQLSTEIERLLVLAPTDATKSDNADNVKTDNFFGNMTKQQLERTIPGFIRVEKILNKEAEPVEPKDFPIPVDHDFENGGNHREVNVDPKVCCRVSRKLNEGTNSNIPRKPAPDDLIVLNTNIKDLSLRQFPTESKMLDWVVLMPGPKKDSIQRDMIGGFWSGQVGSFEGDKKSADDVSHAFAQQGGWMATKTQIIRMNNQLCKSNILPPFNRMGDQDQYYDDLGSYDVEFWSGSNQIFAGGDKHCNIQRIVSMDPGHFSNHLLYHTSNNKQQQRNAEQIVRANNLFGQLNHVRKSAERERIELQKS